MACLYVACSLRVIFTFLGSYDKKKIMQQRLYVTCEAQISLTFYRNGLPIPVLESVLDYTAGILEISDGITRKISVYLGIKKIFLIYVISLNLFLELWT